MPPRRTDAIFRPVREAYTPMRGPEKTVLPARVRVNTAKMPLYLEHLDTRRHRCCPWVMQSGRASPRLGMRPPTPAKWRTPALEPSLGGGTVRPRNTGSSMAEAAPPETKSLLEPV